MKRGDSPAPISQRAVQQLWRYLAGEPWPKGWRVRWEKDTSHVYGRRLKDADRGAMFPDTQEIVLVHRFLRRLTHPIEVLVHELVHLAHPEIDHGEDFFRIHKKWCGKVGIKGLVRAP
jgi:hypothetical protein